MIVTATSETSQPASTHNLNVSGVVVPGCSCSWFKTSTTTRNEPFAKAAQLIIRFAKASLEGFSPIAWADLSRSDYVIFHS
jgi:hypothetical protein